MDSPARKLPLRFDVIPLNRSKSLCKVWCKSHDIELYDIQLSNDSPRQNDCCRHL